LDYNLQRGLPMAASKTSKIGALQEIETFFVLHSEGETS